MKKVITILITLALLLALAPAAFADATDVYFSSLVARSKAAADTLEMSYQRAGRLVFVNFSVEGLTYIVAEARAGNEDYLAVWEQLGPTMLEELAAINEEYSRLVGGDAVIVYTLFAENSPKIIYLSVSEGEIVYDILADELPLLATK